MRVGRAGYVNLVLPAQGCPEVPPPAPLKFFDARRTRCSGSAARRWPSSHPLPARVLQAARWSAATRSCCPLLLDLHSASSVDSGWSCGCQLVTSVSAPAALPVGTSRTRTPRSWWEQCASGKARSCFVSEPFHPARASGASHKVFSSSERSQPVESAVSSSATAPPRSPGGMGIQASWGLTLQGHGCSALLTQDHARGRGARDDGGGGGHVRPGGGDASIRLQPGWPASASPLLGRANKQRGGCWYRAADSVADVTPAALHSRALGVGRGTLEHCCHALRPRQCLGCISPASRLHLACISPASRLRLDLP